MVYGNFEKNMLMKMICNCIYGSLNMLLKIIKSIIKYLTCHLSHYIEKGVSAEEWDESIENALMNWGNIINGDKNSYIRLKVANIIDNLKKSSI